jgi:DNA-binding HxlR family transcriptional regulator
MRQERRLRQFDCPFFGFQQTINGKNKVRILWDLQKGPRRHGEIRHGLLTGNIGSKQISPRVLSPELKELMTLGLIKGQEFEVKPLKSHIA